MLSEYISWSNDGLSIIIYDKNAFADVVLPQYFRSKHIISFIRQLNNYGFKLETLNDTQIKLYHQLFNKDIVAKYGQICSKENMKLTDKNSTLSNDLFTRVLQLPACIYQPANISDESVNDKIPKGKANSTLRVQISNKKEFG